MKFNILNFVKSNTLYTKGLKPLAFSSKKRYINGVVWHRDGLNISYERNNFENKLILASNSPTNYKKSLGSSNDSENSK